MSHIFISYSKKDIEFARHLRELLQEQGFAVWIDETRLVPSEKWWPTIEQNIVSCAAFIVAMSPNALESDWVEREILVAEKRRKPIFPVLLAGEGWTRLGNIQYEDMTAGLATKLEPDFVEGLKRFVPIFTGEPAPPPLAAQPNSPALWEAERTRTRRGGGIIIFTTLAIIVVIAAAILIARGQLSPAAQVTPTQVAVQPTTLQPTVQSVETKAALTLTSLMTSSAKAIELLTHTPTTTSTPTLNEADVLGTMVQNGLMVQTALAVAKIPTLTLTITPTSTPPVCTGYAANGDVSIHSGPGDNYQVISVLRANNSASLLGMNADATWYVVYAQGPNGWIPAQTLTLSGPCGSLPIYQAPPTPISLITDLPFPPSPTYAPSATKTPTRRATTASGPSATMTDTSITQNVTVKGKKGIQFNVSFNVDNFDTHKGVVALLVYDKATDKQVPTDDPNYTILDGLGTGATFQSKTQSSSFSDVPLFIPTSAFNRLGSGTKDLYYVVIIADVTDQNNVTIIGTSDKIALKYSG